MTGFAPTPLTQTAAPTKTKFPALKKTLQDTPGNFQKKVNIVKKGTSADVGRR